MVGHWRILSIEDITSNGSNCEISTCNQPRSLKQAKVSRLAKQPCSTTFGGQDAAGFTWIYCSIARKDGETQQAVAIGEWNPALWSPFGELVGAWCYLLKDHLHACATHAHVLPLLVESCGKNGIQLSTDWLVIYAQLGNRSQLAG